MSPMNDRSLLIVTRDFPPYCNKVGWMIRAATLANFFVDRGFDVHVLCHGRVRQWSFVELRPSIKIHPITDFLAYYDLPRSEVGVSGLVVKVAKRVIKRVGRRRLIDFDHVFVPTFEREAARLIEAHGIRHVLVSTPPHSLQVVGAALKERFGKRITLWADFRDSWTIIPEKTSVHAPELVAREESRVFDKADHVLVVNKGMASAYGRVYPKAKDKIRIVRNGYVSDSKSVEPQAEVREFVRQANLERRVVVGYFGVGGVGKPRNDGKDLDPLFAVLDRDPALARKFAIVVQGEFTVDRKAPEGTSFLSLPAASNAQARANISLIDAGIVLHTIEASAPLVMGGKIYDYMASHVAIWFLVPPNAESLFDIARMSQKPFIADVTSLDSVAATARELAQQKDADQLATRRYTDVDARPFSRDEQYKLILDAMDRP